MQYQQINNEKKVPIHYEKMHIQSLVFTFRGCNYKTNFVIKL